MNYDISFVIPTRNRIKNLSILLNRLLPQFDKNCKLIIVDNASDEFDIYDLKKIIEGFPSINFEILRNKVNIGIDANVVKTFEIPDTQWIFPLGDSKLVSTNCVQKIKEYIQKYADASFINFYFQDIFHEPRYKNIVINEKEDFSKMIDCFGNILLFGNTVYRRNAVQPHISQGYRFIYARCPHVAIAIESINEGYGVLSHEAVLDVMLNKPSMQDLPGIVDCWDSFSFIPYIFNTEESRYRMNKLVAGIDFRGQPISWFLYNTVNSLYYSGDKKLAINKYKSIIFNMYFSVSKLRFLLLFYLPTIWTLVPYNRAIFEYAYKKFTEMTKK